MSRDAVMRALTPVSRARGCQLARCDHWKPMAWKLGTPFFFVVHDCGQNYYVMRLFERQGDRDFWLRRNKRWRGAAVQSYGVIRFKR